MDLPFKRLPEERRLFFIELSPDSEVALSS